MRAEPEEKSIIRDVPASRQDDDPGKGQSRTGLPLPSRHMSGSSGRVIRNVECFQCGMKDESDSIPSC